MLYNQLHCIKQDGSPAVFQRTGPDTLVVCVSTSKNGTTAVFIDCKLWRCEVRKEVEDVSKHWEKFFSEVDKVARKQDHVILVVSKKKWLPQIWGVFAAKEKDWLIDCYHSLTAHQHQKGHTVPKQVIMIAMSIQVTIV